MWFLVPVALAQATPDALTPEMRAWVAENIPRRGGEAERLERLRAALLAPRTGLAYEAGHTGTSAEVWQTRRYDCLSLVLLFVAMAREAGVEAHAYRVEVPRRVHEDGTVVVVAGHVTVGWGPPARPRTIDLGFGETVEGSRLVRLEDDELVALYEVNVGAELLRDGRPDDALPRLEDAVVRAPGLVEAWVDLGVARRRTGDLAGAEDAYLRALALDPDRASAWHDLAVLLDLRGDRRAARELLALADRRSRDSFTYLRLGDWSLEDGDAAMALRFYRRARVTEPWHPSVLAALGEQALAEGDRDRAQRWLRKAARQDALHPRVRALAARLSRAGLPP